MQSTRTDCGLGGRYRTFVATGQVGRKSRATCDPNEPADIIDFCLRAPTLLRGSVPKRCASAPPWFQHRTARLVGAERAIDSQWRTAGVQSSKERQRICPGWFQCCGALKAGDFVSVGVI